MKMDKFYFIFPPRPCDGSIQYGEDTYQSYKTKPGYIAQLKLNGQRNLIYIFPDGHIEMWNRHGEKHRSYTPPKWMLDQITASFRIEPGKFTVLDGELLNNKDSTIKDTLCIWDILVYNGEYLIGTTYGERYNLLLNISAKYADGDYAYEITNKLWVARNILPEMWDNEWAKTKTSYVEGFVLKRLDGKLEMGLKKCNNGSWLVRCRRPHAGGCYKF